MEFGHVQTGVTKLGHSSQSLLHMHTHHVQALTGVDFGGVQTEVSEQIHSLKKLFYTCTEPVCAQTGVPIHVRTVQSLYAQIWTSGVNKIVFPKVDIH